MESKATGYDILKSDDSYELTKQVLRYIKMGYQPFGHPCVYHDGRRVNFVQAVIKYN